MNAEKWTAQFCSQISNILFLKTRWKDNFRSQRNIFKNSLVQEKEETRNRWPYIKMKNYCTWFQVSHSMPIQFQRSRISDNREVPASALTCCLTGLSPIQLPPTDATPAITSTLVSLVAFQKKYLTLFVSLWHFSFLSWYALNCEMKSKESIMQNQLLLLSQKVHVTPCRLSRVSLIWVSNPPTIEWKKYICDCDLNWPCLCVCVYIGNAS